MRLRSIALVLALGLLAVPLAAGAQPPTRVASIGFLETGPLSTNLHLRKLFREQLREFGYIEGQNIAFEARAADGKNERLPGLAAELIGRNVDVIITAGTPAAAAKRATSTIPIVKALLPSESRATFTRVRTRR
jgi:putative ABC transport system substrate-binding protein